MSARSFNNHVRDHLLLYALLAVAMFGIFLLQNRKTGFEEGHHGYLSSHGAALAANISLRHHLLMFTAANISDGKITYDAYNRFPIFPFLLTKIVMFFAEPDLSLKIYVARQLMNVFLALSIVICFLVVKELLKDSFLSLAITLVVFSSYYLLFYSDMIFNDTPALFGFVLALFLVVKCENASIRRLHIILLSILAISMGWQPYAVFFCWFTVTAAWSLCRKSPNTRLCRQLLSHPATLSVVTSVFWGAVILGLQLLNEWAMGDVPFGSMDTISKLKLRIGLGPPEVYAYYANLLNWPPFLSRQAGRMTRMIIPLPLLVTGYAVRVIAILTGIVLVTGAVRFRNNVSVKLLTIFVLSGLFWAFPLKNFVAFHDYESMYYIGIPIAFYTVSSFYLKRVNSKVLALIALILFIANETYINIEKEAAAMEVNGVTSQFQNICDTLPDHSRVYVDGDKTTMGIGHHALNYYLSGHYFASLPEAEYVISKKADYNENRLTGNESINLFKNSR